MDIQEQPISTEEAEAKIRRARIALRRAINAWQKRAEAAGQTEVVRHLERAKHILYRLK